MKAKHFLFQSLAGYFLCATPQLSAQNMAQTGAPYIGTIRHTGGNVAIGSTGATALLDIQNSSNSNRAFNIYNSAAPLAMSLATTTPQIAMFTSTSGLQQPSLTMRNVVTGFNLQVQSTILGGNADFSFGVASHPEALTIEQGTGFVGINTAGTSLQAALQIHKSGQAIMIQADPTLAPNSQACDIVFEHPATGGTNREWVIRSTGPNHTFFPHMLEFWAPEAPNPVVHFPGSNIKVAIGTTSTPGNYGLYVDRGILTEKVKVAINGSAHWADYVFAKDYKLMPLPQLEKFVTESKHLPGIPSAEEVTASGIDLAEMNAKLLAKIEELTLYVIDLEKRLSVIEKNDDK